MAVSVSHILHLTKERLSIAIEASRQRRLGKKLRTKERIKVIFFVLYDSMWKNDKLFRMMMESDRFDPYIVSISHAKQDIATIEENQKKLKSFFEGKGFPFIEGYRPESDSWFDIKSFHPDIVFYQQPYNESCDEYRIKSLSRQCVFCYIPYAYTIERSRFFYNTYLLNIAWKLFYPTEFQTNGARRDAYNKGINIIPTGFPLADYIVPEKRSGNSVWKQEDESIQRVIWAPHHSILNDDMLNYSTFLEVADSMIDLAKKYSGKIQFAFKPHPVLKEKLYRSDVWGVERTDSYYATWKGMDNTCIAESDYMDLFNSSDAMIHDCSSFSVEYLHTCKPVMYLSKGGHESMLNECGLKAYEQHYKGCSIAEIEAFLNDVVLDGKDTMLPQRREFFDKYLLPPGEASVAENIFRELDIHKG